MADINLTNLYTEVLTQNASADVRLTSLYAEALTQNSTADIRLSSLYTEVLINTFETEPPASVEKQYPFIWMPV